MVRYKSYQLPVFLIAPGFGFQIYVSHRKYAKSRHVPREGVRKFNVRFVAITREPRISEISRCIFVQRIETVFSANGISSGVSVTSNAVIVPLWQEFVAWRVIQNRKYLPRVKYTPGILKPVAKSSSNLPDYYFFFFKSKCLSKCCLHSRQRSRVLGYLRRHFYKNNNEESETRRKLVPNIISRCKKKFVGLAAPNWRQAMLESPVKNII